jgi:hypothetical protein
VLTETGFSEGIEEGEVVGTGALDGLGAFRNGAFVGLFAVLRVGFSEVPVSFFVRVS